MITLNYDAIMEDISPTNEMTEQKYLQTCNTEQLIRFLLWYPYNVHGYPKPKMSIAEEEDAFREWLKQPHTKGVTK